MGILKEINRLAFRITATVVRTVEDVADDFFLLRKDTKPKKGSH